MGAYSVQLKHMLGREGESTQQGARKAPSVAMPMFFGFLGVSAMVLGVPIFILVVCLGVQGWYVHFKLFPPSPLSLIYVAHRRERDREREGGKEDRIKRKGDRKRNGDRKRRIANTLSSVLFPTLARTLSFCLP